MMVNFITRRFFILVQLIVRLFRRALCCFRRRRRSSCEPTPLTNIGVVSDGEIVDGQNWEGWEEGHNEAKLNPMEQHIRMYRQQRANLNQAKTDEDPPVDFFLDMTPRIVKQKKLLLQNEKTEPSNSSSFSLAPDPVFSTPDLGVWEESQTWEAEAGADVDVMDVIREQKRQDRERRQQDQQRRKNERTRQGVVTRLS